MILRTRFKKDIVTEYVVPRGRGRGVIVLCSGLPSSTDKTDLLEFLSARGYWVFCPRYRGTWESGGFLFQYSPEKDVADVLLGLQKPFKDLWSGKTYNVPFRKAYVVGSSFGGTAAVLLSSHPRVIKSYALSTIVNWRREHSPLVRLRRYLRDGYGVCYRFQNRDWLKLGRSSFYNPVDRYSQIAASRLALVHAEDDAVADWRSVKLFCKTSGCELTLLKRGGHFGLSTLMTRSAYRRFEKFIHA